MKAEQERRAAIREAEEARERRLRQLERAADAEANFRDFIEQAWPYMDSRPFKGSWYFDVIADHLEALYRGDIRRLVINIPPRFAKSLTCSVAFPAWVWIKRPEFKLIRGSYDMKLSTRDNTKCRELMLSAWYQMLWADRFQFKGDQNVKTRFENTKQGHQLATSPGTSATGDGGDLIMADDPNAADDRWNPNALQRSADWWDGTMSSRLDDPKTGRKLIVMQRIADNDLTAHVLRAGGYVHLEIPHEYSPTRVYPVDFRPAENPVAWTDPRTEEGELLHPERIGRDEADELKGEAGLGSDGYEAQYNQNPSPSGGGMFKPEWWNYWQLPGMNLPPVRVQSSDGSWIEKAPVDLPEVFEQEAQSWDLSFDDTKGADFTAGQHWGIVGPRKYWLDEIHGRMNSVAQLAAIRRATAEWPEADLKLIEKKANGAAVIALLIDEIAGIVPFDPGTDSKPKRASIVSPQIEAGNVYLPHPAIKAWVHAFLKEAKAFPGGANDDRIDAMVQLLLRFRTGRDPSVRSLG